MKRFLLILFLFVLHQSYAQTLTGYVKDAVTDELLPGATVFISGTQNGVVTNKYGFYSLTANSPNITVVVQYLGYETAIKEFTLNESTTFDFLLNKSDDSIEEVVIDGTREDVVESVQMSKIQVEVQDVKDLPALLGEKDVLKTLQLLPGVQSGNEAQSGFYVRGGGPDQNLIILDEAPVYNASHLFGFFSLFNGDALKSVELTKGGFPARYGGRLSSVVDMTAKEGSKDHVTGSANIGIISSSGVLEGPLSKKHKKASFLVSGRRTYADIFTRALSSANSDGDESGGYYFYDLIAKTNYDIDDKNRVFLSGYFGRDKAGVTYKDGGEKEKGSFGWGNATGTARWNHIFSPKVFSNASLIFSHYDFTLKYEENYDNEKYEFKYQSGIEDVGFKYDFDIFPNNKHAIKTGVAVTRHLFEPKVRIEVDESLNINSREREDYSSIESAFYIEDEWFITDKFKANLGFRLSHYIEDDVDYFRPEPRASFAYQANEDLSLKASYAEMNQYIHLLSNTGAGLPTDLWVPSTDIVKPQFSRQYAIGAAKNVDWNNLVVTLEGYYKEMDNIISYKEGSSFLQVEAEEEGGRYVSDWQSNITDGKGDSYGVELMVKKDLGRLHGWTGYTWSKTTHEFEELNNGKPFPPRYDRRHDLSIVGMYDIKENKLLSATFVYGSGQAITLPRAEYNVATDYSPFDGGLIPRNSRDDYGEKNSSRMEAYHRLDVAYRFEKEKRKGTKAWEFGLYNIYNRKNPFFYYIDENEDRYQLKNASLFHLIPTISWSYKFK